MRAGKLLVFVVIIVVLVAVYFKKAKRPVVRSADQTSSESDTAATVKPVAVDQSKVRRRVSASVPSPASAEYQRVFGAWESTLQQESFAPKEFPYDSGVFTTETDLKGNVVQRLAIWSQRADRCRLRVVFDPGWAVLESKVECH